MGAMSNDAWETALAASIGQVARRARKALGLTQKETAARIGVTEEFYARIERGNAFPSVPTLRRLADVLDVSADALFGAVPFRVEPEVADPPRIRRIIQWVRAATRRQVRLIGLFLKERANTGSDDAQSDESRP
jgi:transcriptional regulator with XRE-family HTH domain